MPACRCTLHGCSGSVCRHSTRISDFAEREKRDSGVRSGSYSERCAVCGNWLPPFSTPPKLLVEVAEKPRMTVRTLRVVEHLVRGVSVFRFAESAMITPLHLRHDGVTSAPLFPLAVMLGFLFGGGDGLRRGNSSACPIRAASKASMNSGFTSS